MHQEAVGVFVLGLTYWTISVSVSRPLANDNSQGPWSLEKDLVCPNKTYPYWIDDLQMVGCFNWTMSCEPLRRAPTSKVTESEYDETSTSEDRWSFKKDIYIISITISVLGTILTTLAFTTEKSCLAAIRSAIRKEWHVVWNGVATSKKIQEMIEKRLTKLGDADKERLCDGAFQLVKNAAIERTITAGKKDGKELCQVLCGKVPDAAEEIGDYIKSSFTEWKDSFVPHKTSSKPKAQQMIDKLLDEIYASCKRRRFYFPFLEKEIENYLGDFIPSGDQSREELSNNGPLLAPSTQALASIPRPQISNIQPEPDQRRTFPTTQSSRIVQPELDPSRSSYVVLALDPSEVPAYDTGSRRDAQIDFVADGESEDLEVIIPTECINTDSEFSRSRWVEIYLVNNKFVSMQQIFTLIDANAPVEDTRSVDVCGGGYLRGYYQDVRHLKNVFVVEFSDEVIAKHYGEIGNGQYMGIEYNFRYINRVGIRCVASGFQTSAQKEVFGGMIENAVFNIEFVYTEINRKKIRTGISSATMHVAEPANVPGTLRISCPEIGLLEHKCEVVPLANDPRARSGDLARSNTCPETPSCELDESPQQHVATTDHNSVDQPPQYSPRASHSPEPGLVILDETMLSQAQGPTARMGRYESSDSPVVETQRVNNQEHEAHGEARNTVDGLPRHAHRDETFADSKEDTEKQEREYLTGDISSPRN